MLLRFDVGYIVAHKDIKMLKKFKKHCKVTTSHLQINKTDLSQDKLIHGQTLYTLESGINVPPCINIAPGTFDKNNKRSPLNKRSPS